MSLPTTTQVTDYINTLTQPVSSKAIAKHFNCKAKDINKNRADYIGIYNNPDVISCKVTYTHSKQPATPSPHRRSLTGELQHVSDRYVNTLGLHLR